VINTNKAPNYLFLEVSELRDKIRLSGLYTPFDKVLLSAGGIVSTLEKIDWEIEDVTSKIQSYKYPRKEPVVRRSESVTRSNLIPI